MLHATTGRGASRLAAPDDLGRVDDGTDFGHRLVVRDQAAGFDVLESASDSLDDFQLAVDIRGNGLAARNDLLRCVSDAIRSSFSLTSGRIRIVIVVLFAIGWPVC